MGIAATRCCKREKPQPTSPTTAGLKVLAAQTLKIASINGLGDTEKIETELEDEIRWEESRSPPKEIIGRLRRKCEELVHSKQVLMCVVILNVLDCLLVIGELTLEFRHVSQELFNYKEVSQDFVKKMKDFYRGDLQDLGVQSENVVDLFNRILKGFVFWMFSSREVSHYVNECKVFVNASLNFSSLSQNLSANGAFYDQQEVSLVDWFVGREWNPSFYNGSLVPKLESESKTVKVAHGLHFGSISILCLLVAETLLKILCTGRRFFKKKMEVFDAVIIFISFILDLIFVEGLTNLQLNNFVLILSFLLPWRILRVLNSLIVAVMDQQRFHMKLLYKQKRKVTKQLSEATDKLKVLEKQIEGLKELCLNRGVQEWEIKKITGQNGQGGMKALSKLIFQAADAFAPMSSPQLNGCRSVPRDDTSSSHSLDSPRSGNHVTNGNLVQRWGEPDTPLEGNPMVWLTDSSGKTVDTVLSDEDFISRL